MLLQAGNPANYVSNVRDSREHEPRQSLFHNVANCIQLPTVHKPAPPRISINYSHSIPFRSLSRLIKSSSNVQNNNQIFSHLLQILNFISLYIQEISLPGSMKNTLPIIKSTTLTIKFCNFFFFFFILNWYELFNDEYEEEIFEIFANRSRHLQVLSTRSIPWRWFELIRFT